MISAFSATQSNIAFCFTSDGTSPEHTDPSDANLVGIAPREGAVAGGTVGSSFQTTPSPADLPPTLSTQQQARMYERANENLTTQFVYIQENLKDINGETGSLSQKSPSDSVDDKELENIRRSLRATVLQVRSRIMIRHKLPGRIHRNPHRAAQGDSAISRLLDKTWWLIEEQFERSEDASRYDGYRKADL